MSSHFFTEISSQHASARVEVTNINGDVFNTTIYIVDSERESGDLVHLAQFLTDDFYVPCRYQSPCVATSRSEGPRAN